MTTTPPAPTLTPSTSSDPCPRVEVVVTPMPGDADTITVWRSWKGQYAVVRDADAASVSGDFLVVDYEVPLGVPVTYTCRTADAAGTPSQESSGTTTTVNVSELWIQDPLDPTTALAARIDLVQTTGVSLHGESFMPATYSADIQITPVAGSALPVAFSGTRRAASRMPLSLITWDVDATDQLRLLLRQAFPLCIRTPADIPQLTGLTYVALDDVLETPYPGWDSTLFTATVDSVRGPGAGIVVQVRTYDDLLDEAGTYSALLGLYSTYVEVLRGP